jgi:hypothetical protein
MNKINDFPGVASKRGKSFVFTSLSHIAPFLAINKHREPKEDLQIFLLSVLSLTCI